MLNFAPWRTSLPTPDKTAARDTLAVIFALIRAFAPVGICSTFAASVNLENSLLIFLYPVDSKNFDLDGLNFIIRSSILAGSAKLREQHIKIGVAIRKFRVNKFMRNFSIFF